MTQTISTHAAFVYAMVIVSGADGRMTDAELGTIGEVVKKFPIFRDFDVDRRLVQVAQECGSILQEDGGLHAVLGLVAEAVPERLKETAYAAAVEVAAADDRVGREELRVLDMLRIALGIERLHAGAIERSARARHMTE
jgi:tellurite resistance protein